MSATIQTRGELDRRRARGPFMGFVDKFDIIFSSNEIGDILLM